MNNHSESSLGTTGEEDPTPQEAPDRGGPTLDENFPVTTTEDAPAEERGEPTLQQNDDPELPRWFPRGCRTKEPVYYGNQEALGWALDTVGRSVAFIGAGSFLGTALLKLAKEAAGCETEPPPGSHKVPDCNERVYGIRPSSLLTTYTIVVGVVSAALLPLMGAVVDYTPHRRKAGRWFSFMFCIILFPQIFLNENTWFAVAILQMILAFIGWAQTMVTFAYLPELSDSEQRLNEYTQSFTIVGFGSMVIYLMCIIGVAFAAGISDNDVATAQLGTSVSFVVSCVTLYVSWGKLMLKRPAARTLPEGRTLWTAGFIQVYHTSIHICKHFPALKWFYVSIMFIDSAINSVATIMITYLSDTLDFSSTENGIAILCMLIGSIPGAVVAGKSHKHWNPIRGSILATLVLLVNTVVAAIVLKEPGQQVQTYVFGVCYGLGIGWKWTTDKLLASVLIPEGQDAELMGVYLFAGQILTWLPPLVFTALNEAGVSQRVGIGTLGIYFFLGMIALAMMGSYREAIQVAGRHVLPDASQHQQQNNWDESAITSNGDCRPTGQEKFEVEVAHIDSKGGGSLKTD